MQFRRVVRKTDSEERILPLINVVFLLLIFFMLAGRLTDPAPFPVTPPASAAAGPLQAAPGKPQRATLLLAADGRLALDGVPLAKAALRSAMAERLAGNPDIAVHLKADSAAEATAVVAVMELLRDAGVARLQLLAQSPSEGALPAGAPPHKARP